MRVILQICLVDFYFNSHLDFRKARTKVVAFNKSLLLSMEGMHLYSKLKPADQVFTLNYVVHRLCNPQNKLNPLKQLSCLNINFQVCKDL